MALMLYPHAMTAALSASSARVIRRNAAILPAYSFVLGLIALLGFMAIAAGIKEGPKAANFAVPDLFLKFFPDWFVGVAFAAVAIGALVPAAVMSIAAANLFTRNIWCEYVRPGSTPEQESKVAKLVSLVVKLGALAFVIWVPTQYAIDLQLLGGIWMLQTFPAIVIGLYTRWFHRWALLAGWAAGLTAGALMLYDTPNPLTGKAHFGGAQYALSNFGLDTKVTIYTGIIALTVNLVVVTVASLVLRAAGADAGTDATRPADYRAGARDPGVRPIPVSPRQKAPA
jgi:SSS family solute:Na+ symporter